MGSEDRQGEEMNTIRNYLLQHGPAYRDQITKAVGLSYKTVDEILHPSNGFFIGADGRFAAEEMEKK